LNLHFNKVILSIKKICLGGTPVTPDVLYMPHSLERIDLFKKVELRGRKSLRPCKERIDGSPELRPANKEKAPLKVPPEIEGPDMMSGPFCFLGDPFRPVSGPQRRRPDIVQQTGSAV
jgi:hypothetical protein